MAGLSDFFNDKDKVMKASQFLLGMGQGMTQANSQGLSPFASLAYGFGQGSGGLQEYQQLAEQRETRALQKQLAETQLARAKREESEAAKTAAVSRDIGTMLQGGTLPPAAGSLPPTADAMNAPNAAFDRTDPADLTDPTQRAQLAGLVSQLPGGAGINSAVTLASTPAVDKKNYQVINGKLIDLRSLQQVADFSDPKTQVVSFQDGKETVTAVLDSQSGEVIREVGRGEKGPLVAVDQRGNRYPQPEPGMAYLYNEDGSVKLDERGVPIQIAMKGTKQYQERLDAEEKQKRRDEAAATYADVVTEDIDRVIANVRDAILPTTGLGGSFLQNIPGTAARDIRGLVDTIRANVGFDKLQQIRDASPTGGALGPVSDFENRLMQATIGNLEQSQTQEQFLYNMARVKRIYAAIATRGIEPGDLQEGDYGAPPTGELPAIGHVEGGYLFMGGDPGNRDSWFEVR